MINITNLSKNFGDKIVLNNLSKTFTNGKTYGIVGENGSGKTTLFECITGIEKYNGLITSPLHPLKNHIAYLPTEPYFFAKLTGREYIQLLCNARNIVLTNLDSKNIFGLPLNQYAATYSTGMKKKLALTAILLQKNQYYILDEPYNGVDIQSNIMITEIIKKLNTLGKVVLIASHIFSTLTAVCNEILLLKNGQFSEAVYKHDYEKLELEMKALFIGDKINALELE